MRRAWSLGLLAALACSETPEDVYDDYRERTGERRVMVDAGPEPDGAPGTYFDLSGRFVMRALLAGGIRLDLRVELEAIGDAAEPPSDFVVKVWLERQTYDDSPLTTTTTLIGDDGCFDIVLDPLEIPRDVVNTDSDIAAKATLQACTVDLDQFCGIAVGRVRSPLDIDLVGSTFYARRDDGEITSDELPFECPLRTGGGVDAGVADAAVEGDGGVEVERPASPDLGAVDSRRRNLSGHYIVVVDTPLIDLQLWIGLLDTGGESGRLDGTLRLATQPVDEPPLANFAATVDDDGRFEIWLPDFELVTPNVTVEADILLTAATVPDGFCGAGAGAVRTPVMLDLAGSTFGALPWQPGTEPPDDVPTSCEAFAEEPEPDMGVAPEPDMGVEPEPDMGVAPEPDMGVEPEPDMGVEPEPDMGVEPDMSAPDLGPELDMSAPDLGVEPDMAPAPDAG